MLQEIYYNWFNKESAAISRLHEIRVKVAVEHLRSKPRQHSPPSQQQNKGTCDNNKKEIRTWATTTHKRTEITTKDNVQAEMSMTTVDQTARVTADPVTLCQLGVFCDCETKLNKNNAQSLLNKKSGNHSLAYQSQQDQKSCRNNSKG